MAIIVNVDVMMARRKMSSGELAERVGITPANLSVLKTGKAKAIRFTTLEAICQALDCNADYFFSGVISDSLPEQIGEMLSSLSVEEQRMVWRLVDCYIHQKDDSAI